MRASLIVGVFRWYYLALVCVLGWCTSAQAQSIGYATWNTFLGMNNIIELSNPNDGTVTVIVSIFSATGEAIHSFSTSVDGVSQRDFILNSVASLPVEAYGLVEVNSASPLVSRVSFYLPEPTGSGYQFAFTEAVRDPNVGPSSVSFNTFQPSTNALDAGQLVANWLALVNLSPTESAQFNIKRYDMLGVLQTNSSVTLLPHARLDLPAGHDLGISTVGLMQIEPADLSAPYLAHLVRYGYSVPGEQNAFRFAFPLQALESESAQATDRWVNVSRGAGALNWIELVNRSSETVTASVQFIANDGALRGAINSVMLSPYAQQHINASEFMLPGESGVARISASHAEQLSANSMFYYFDAAGRIEAMYGNVTNDPLAADQIGSWNLYLGMFNWLRVFNIGTAPVAIEQRVFRDGYSYPITFSLQPLTGTDIALHDTVSFGTTTNAFGLLNVTGQDLQLELLRVRTNSSGGIDFAFPIPFASGSVAPRPEKEIWRPAPGTNWQWQLTGEIDTSFDVQMYDVDLVNTSQSVIDELKAAGRKVICYFSAGSWEAFREDAGNFPPETLGMYLEGYDDERWLDVRQIDLLAPIMRARLDLAVQKRCDGVEPDNVDGYTNNSGFPLTASDQIAFNRWIANEAHSRRLSVGLKNDIYQLAELVSSFDWALNEQCFQYDECAGYQVFISAGKAVFGVEYEGDPAVFCPLANAMNLDWLEKNLELDASRYSCR